MRTGMVFVAVGFMSVLIAPANADLTGVQPTLPTWELGHSGTLLRVSAGSFVNASGWAYNSGLTTATGVDDFGIAGAMDVLNSGSPTVPEGLSDNALVEVGGFTGRSRDSDLVQHSGTAPHQIAGRGEDYTVWPLLSGDWHGGRGGQSIKDLTMSPAPDMGRVPRHHAPAPAASVLGLIGLGLVGWMRRRAS